MIYHHCTVIIITIAVKPPHTCPQECKRLLCKKEQVPQFPFLNSQYYSYCNTTGTHNTTGNHSLLTHSVLLALGILLALAMLLTHVISLPRTV